MNQRGCDSVVIHNYQLADLSVDLGPDLRIAKGDSVLLQPELSGDYISFRWMPEVFLDDANILSPFTKPDQTIEYEFEILNALGCVAMDNIVIQVEQPEDAEDEINIYIPNIFSPNGDGLNDVFRPELGEGSYTLERLQIFDRWGSRVYDCKGSDCAWRGNVRGSSASKGVYVFEMQFRIEDGRLLIKNGDVTLVR
jgi:gliding motility-associated-like protein